jgi:hypothetical protein
MKINYNVTGEKRKALAGAISEELNAPVKYLGAPTFAYEVGDYIIDKSGVLSGEDNPSLVADLQGLHDFKPVSEEYDTPLPEAEPIPDDIRIPYEAELGGRVTPYRDFEEPPYGTPEPAETINLTVEIPRLDFDDKALKNLQNILSSKGSLIKKVLGRKKLVLGFSNETIKFPWFTDGMDGETVKAYTHFITALCEMAKTQHRVSPVEKAVDNEKYTFRCFLLRLGFIGNEYKAERKLLLKHLSGNSAFKVKAEEESE